MYLYGEAFYTSPFHKAEKLLHLKFSVEVETP